MTDDGIPCPIGCEVKKPTKYAVRDHVLNVHPEMFHRWADRRPPEATERPSGATGDRPGHQAPGAVREAAGDPVPGRPGAHRVERYAATLYHAATGRDWEALPIGDVKRSWWLTVAGVAARLADDDLSRCVNDKNRLVSMYKSQLSEVYVELEQLRLKVGAERG